MDTLQLETLISEWVAQKLNLTAADIDRHAPLMDLGLDSLVALELSGCLESMVSREVSPLIIMEYPTIAAVAAFLARPVPEVPGGVTERMHAAA